ncbi:MAG: sulfurtransferase complex subunit TusC [Gammaproteobacteria bacterium]|nr:sulfurtransferase complex subunit TusC [Gammaproteobacteria bacterium]MBI5782782.1 sulfurtransferase complex subunit TusC [Gammaproteobacteria bacterium]
MTEATGGVEMEEDTGGKVKKFLYINRKAPYGTIYALESLEVVLIAAAFDQDVSLAFLDDGVYQIVKGQHTKPIDVKNFSPTFRALEGYDIEKLYVEKESMEVRGLKEEDFIVPVKVVDAQEMADIMQSQDIILSF